jgi:hypothetical protein
MAGAAQVILAGPHIAEPFRTVPLALRVFSTSLAITLRATHAGGFVDPPSTVTTVANTSQPVTIQIIDNQRFPLDRFIVPRRADRSYGITFRVAAGMSVVPTVTFISGPVGASIPTPGSLNVGSMFVVPLTHRTNPRLMSSLLPPRPSAFTAATPPPPPLPQFLTVTDNTGWRMDLPVDTVETPLPGELRLDTTFVDPVGPDLPQERIRISNVSGIRQQLSGCVLWDHHGDVQFRFPLGFVLEPSTSVDVWTKSGTDTPTDLFLNRGKPVWDNAGDKVSLTNAAFDVVDETGLFSTPHSAKTLVGVPSTIIVPESVSGVDTGLTVEEGDFVVINSSGSVNAGGGHGPWGPDGANEFAYGPDWPLEGVRKFALLVGVVPSGGLVPAQPLMLAGSGFQQPVLRPPLLPGQPAMLRPGRLVLLINDNVPGGGSGQFSSQISIFRK